MSRYSTIPQGAKVDNITTNLNSSGQIQVIKTYTYHYENDFSGGLQAFNGALPRATTIPAGTLATGTELIIRVNLSVTASNVLGFIGFRKHIKINGVSMISEGLTATLGDGTQEKVLTYRYTLQPIDDTQDLIIDTGVTNISSSGGGSLYLTEDRINLFGTLK